MAAIEKKQYDVGDVADGYASYEAVPLGRLEGQFMRRALGDCTGLRVLDLGGGSGSHARRAVEAGAELVDVVDISEAMLRAGRATEARAGREGRIRWHAGDATHPLADQGLSILPGAQYDLVMANWLLDHATSPAELRAMWANVAACLRPGGRFLGIRATRAALTSDRFHTGHYGVLIEHVHEPSEHGARYRVSLVSDPRVSFEATPQPDLYDMVDEVPRALGFTGFASVPLAGLPVLDEDPAFWKEMLEEPVFAIVTATKA